MEVARRERRTEGVAGWWPGRGSDGGAGPGKEGVRSVGHHLYQRSRGVQGVLTLGAVSALNLLSHNIQDGVDQLRSLGVVRV
jgi:hypothetical protein